MGGLVSAAYAAGFFPVEVDGEGLSNLPVRLATRSSSRTCGSGLADAIGVDHVSSKASRLQKQSSLSNPCCQ